jgi:localization factor PodJL
MASGASWQSGNAEQARQDHLSLEGRSMGQRTVEALIRRLLERVEESECRYSEAIEELHARLDQLSHSTEVAQATGSPEEIEALNRVRDQVSDLARRLEQSHTAAPSLDEILTSAAPEAPAAPSLEDILKGEIIGTGPAAPSLTGIETPGGEAACGESSGTSSGISSWPDLGGADLDKRLLDMAQRLESSIATAMLSSEFAVLNARLDEIAARFDAGFGQSAKCEQFEHIERQLSEMRQQLGRAELQIARISGIESQLLRLIERLDEASGVEQVASAAASEAARLVTGNGKMAPERLDAIHRDLQAMNDRTRATDDRLADTLSAVHKSLRQLVEQVERGREPKGPSVPRRYFPKRGAEIRPAPATPPQFATPPLPPELTLKQALRAAAGTPEQTNRPSLRSRLGGAVPGFAESEESVLFGRARRVGLEEAVDKPEVAPAFHAELAELGPEDNFIAAARRAAQAAAAQAEERGASRLRKARPSVSAAPSVMPEPRRRRPLLILIATLLLLASAALLYSRLKSRPEPGAPFVQTEESMPGPTLSNPPGAPKLEEQPSHQPAPPGSGQPHATEPPAEPAAPAPRSSESDVLPPVRVGEVPEDAPPLAAAPAPSAAVSEVAKTPAHQPPVPVSEVVPSPETVALKPDQAASAPGAVLALQEPNAKRSTPKAEEGSETRGS